MDLHCWIIYRDVFTYNTKKLILKNETSLFNVQIAYWYNGISDILNKRKSVPSFVPSCDRALFLSLVAPMILTSWVTCVSCRAPLRRSQPAAAQTISPPSYLSSTTPRNSFTSLSWTIFLCLSSQSHSGDETPTNIYCCVVTTSVTFISKHKLIPRTK